LNKSLQTEEENMATNQALVEAIYAWLNGTSFSSAAWGGVSRYTMSALGLRVNRAAIGDLAGPTTIFTIAGGAIILTGLTGIVATARNAGGGETTLFIHSQGATPLNNVLFSVTGNAAQGTAFTITGNPVDGLLIGAGGAAVNAFVPLSSGMMGSPAGVATQQMGMLMGVGTIRVTLSIGGGTGTTRYIMTYIPLDDAVTVL
jgi:hypothetical protein